MTGLVARLNGCVGGLALDVSLEAPAGAVTGLLGASGAGKTTLLRALAGLERLEGEVACDGETWQDGRRFVPPHRRGVGYAFQHSALLPHLTAAGNLAYAARRSGSAAIEPVADLMGLQGLLDRRPERLSGGERRRVAVARALLARPQLVLLDEPLTGLDPAARADLLPRLRGALTGLSVPVVYVSHDPAEVRKIADRVLRLAGGRLSPVAADADPLAGRSEAEVAALARAALRAGLAADRPTLRPAG